MKSPLWFVLAVVLISLGGAMIGRALMRWVQQKLTRAHLLAGPVSGMSLRTIRESPRLSALIASALALAGGLGFLRVVGGDSGLRTVAMACAVSLGVARYLMARHSLAGITR